MNNAAAAEFRAIFGVFYGQPPLRGCSPTTNAGLFLTTCTYRCKLGRCESQAHHLLRCLRPSPRLHFSESSGFAPPGCSAPLSESTLTYYYLQLSDISFRRPDSRPSSQGGPSAITRP
ncbi:hypothetical protein M758_3G269700 [Ceratodon purpureus]|nr:hypothetical protein M758_3G269700 [Ceratodon purpureus]